MLSDANVYFFIGQFLFGFRIQASLNRYIYQRSSERETKCQNAWKTKKKNIIIIIITISSKIEKHTGWKRRRNTQSHLPLNLTIAYSNGFRVKIIVCMQQKRKKKYQQNTNNITSNSSGKNAKFVLYIRVERVLDRARE